MSARTQERTKVLGGAALSTVLAAGLLAPAWAGPGDDTLTVAMEQGLSTVNSYFNIANEVGIFQKQVWDGLLYYDNQTGEVVPNLAESFALVDDLVMEFKIRSGVTFHDGTPFTVDDAVYTLQYAANPDNGILRRNAVNWIESVEKIDDQTMRITMASPAPGAIVDLGRNLPIFKVGAFEGEGLDANPIGTGPYKVVELDPGGTFRLERNEDIFEGSPKGMAEIGTLVWRTIPDKSTQVAEIFSGGVDWIYKVPPDEAEQMGMMPNITSIGVPTPRISYVMFDASGASGDTPTTDIRVRQAVAHAIDRQAIAENLIRGASTPIDALCFPGHFGCTQDVTHYEYDPEKARALLAEAGYADGLEITLASWRDRPVIEAMIGNLRAVGIEVDLNFMPTSAVIEKWVSDGWPMVSGARGLTYPDVAAMAMLFFDMGARDMARDQQVADWLKEGHDGTVPEEREAAYAKALGRIAEQAYALPLFTYSTSFVYRSDLDIAQPYDEQPSFYDAQWTGD